MVEVVNACDPQPGEFITNTALAYDAATQTLTLTCSSSAPLPQLP